MCDFSLKVFVQCFISYQVILSQEEKKITGTLEKVEHIPVHTYMCINRSWVCQTHTGTH